MPERGGLLCTGTSRTATLGTPRIRDNVAAGNQLIRSPTPHVNNYIQWWFKRSILKRS